MCEPVEELARDASLGSLSASRSPAPPRCVPAPRRFAHVQCWSTLHPGILSAATRAALAGQSLDADDVLVRGEGGGGAEGDMVVRVGCGGVDARPTLRVRSDHSFSISALS